MPLPNIELSDLCELHKLYEWAVVTDAPPEERKRRYDIRNQTIRRFLQEHPQYPHLIYYVGG